MTTYQFKLVPKENGYEVIETSGLGPRGPKGDPGSRWIAVEGPPDSSVGRDGDFALDTVEQSSTFGYIWGPKENGLWPAPVQIKGAEGEPGPPGIIEFSEQVPAGLALEPTAGTSPYPARGNHAHKMPALSELTDVELADVANGQVPTYQDGVWINKTPPAGSGGGTGPTEGMVDLFTDSFLDSFGVRGTIAGGFVENNDPRLSNKREPLQHAASHGANGTDPITPASIGAVASTDARLTNDRTPADNSITPSKFNAAAFGTTSTTVARGNDPRLSDERVPKDASVTAAKVHPTAFGTSAGSIAQGNDPRFSDQRIPANSSVTSEKIHPTAFGDVAGKVTQGNDPRLSNERPPTNGSVTAAKLAPGLIGIGPNQIAAGNDPRIVNARNAEQVAAAIAAHNDEIGAHDVFIGPTLPAGTTESEWSATNAELLVRKTGNVVQALIRTKDQAQVPNTPTPVEPESGEDLTLAYEGHVAQFVTPEGKYLTNQAGDFISSMAVAEIMTMAVLARDQATYDAVVVWSGVMKRTNQATAKELLAQRWDATGNAISDNTVNTAAEWKRLGAAIRAWNLWGRVSDRDLAVAIAYDLERYFVVYDEGRAYPVESTRTQSGTTWMKIRADALNPVVVRMAKTFRGLPVYDHLLNGIYDSLVKFVSDTVNTSKGLAPAWFAYDTATHHASAITNGQNGWTETLSTNHTLTAGRLIENLAADRDLFGEVRARDFLQGAFKGFLTAEWAAAGKIVTEYTHLGAAVGSTEDNRVYLRAVLALTTNDANNATATAIKSTKLRPGLSTNSSGYFFAPQIQGQTPVADRDGGAQVWLGRAVLAGLFADLAQFGSNPTAGTGLTPGGGGGTGQPPVEVPDPNPPTPGTFKPGIDQTSQIWAIAQALPTGAAGSLTQVVRDTHVAHATKRAQGKWVGEWDQQWTQAKLHVDRCTAAGEVPFLLSYFIPFRDAGQYSSGGAGTNEEYHQYIMDAAVAIGNRHAVLCLEPDSLPHMPGLSQEQRTGRMSNMRWALQYLVANCPKIELYIDCGHPEWLSAQQAAELLLQAGVEFASGFSINVSNFINFEKCVLYGQQILAILGFSHLQFTIDCSRNGNPNPANHWANPPRRRSGPMSRWGDTGVSGCRGWVDWKAAGESDGNSGDGAPSAGQWWDKYFFNTSIVTVQNPYGYNINGDLVSQTSGLGQRPGAAIGTVPAAPAV